LLEAYLDELNVSSSGFRVSKDRMASLSMSHWLGKGIVTEGQ
jgi:hypothetical protein